MVDDTPPFLCQKCRLETVNKYSEDRHDWSEEDMDQPVDWSTTGHSEQMWKKTIFLHKQVVSQNYVTKKSV